MKKSPPTQSRKPIPKYLAAGVLSVVVFGVVMLTRVPGPFNDMMARTNFLFYDNYFNLRPIEDRTNGPVVIVTADQPSLDAVDKGMHYGWPWPRELWGDIATYVSDSGAKAIAFDLTFSESSIYNNLTGDDDTFASLIKALKCPVVFVSHVDKQGNFERLAPPIPSPVFGAANTGEDDTIDNGRMDKEAIQRDYNPIVFSRDSLATAAVKAAGHIPRQLGNPSFRMHFFGPNFSASKKSTFKYISASNVLLAQTRGKELSQSLGISPELFKGKIVLLGTTAMGTHDIKATPWGQFPGVEIQATGIENLLFGLKVTEIAPSWLTLLAFICTVAGAFGVIYPRTAGLKLLLPLLALVVVFGSGILLFRSADIHWLPPAESLLALLLATPTAFAYTYFVEDRQARFMLEALSKVVSPTVANTLAKNPVAMTRNTDRRLLTVLFTDLANFTSLSETMSDDNKKLVTLLDDYLDAMSDEVIKQNGTLDKYIGDSVMCFWNAPLEQADHAVRACRAALAMQALKKEYSITIKGKEMKIYTRIGINTTLAGFGFVGSSHLMNYTVLGDGVNLASRLEGANKLYGSRILISEDTANLVRSQFHLRKLDSLVVKGKTKPIDVFELLAERYGTTPPFAEKVAMYESALKAYQQRQWDVAERDFLALCQRFGDDPSSRTFLKRIANNRIKEPPADWSGAYDADEK